MVSDRRYIQSACNSKITATFLFIAGLVFSKVSAEIEQGRTCHWCGPLAEQVHRSRRAPACSGAAPDHTTLCEPGLAHCATVATAPPQIISRYCVKLYQDDCYSQFCNTTQKWKMTCPCKGDFCNGDLGAREKEAFLLLAKLASKIPKKIKKRTVSDTFIQEKHDHQINNTKNVVSVHNAEVEKVDESNSLKMGENENGSITHTTSENLSIKQKEDSKIVVPSKSTDDADKQNSNNLNSLNSDKFNIYSAHDKDPSENEVANKKDKLELELNNRQDKDTISPIQATKNMQDFDETNIKKNKDKNTSIAAVNALNEKEHIILGTEPTILSTKLESKILVNNEEIKPSISNVRPTEKLPSESLQQHVTPKTDNIEKVTTTEITDTEATTTNMAAETTAKPKMKKNNSSKNSYQLMVLFVSSILKIFIV